MLLAVERVGADVAALTRLMASQPAEVAAHVDIDSATAAIAVRVSALGSNLDQLRLSLLAGLDRATERLDQPVWLPQLQAKLSEAAQAPEDEVGPALAELIATVAGLADGVQAGAAVADALEHMGGRLAAIEAAAAQVAGDARLLVDRVTPLPDRLGAIAVQIDRMTPLARAGDDVGSLLGQLNRVGGGLEVVLARLAGGEDRSATGARVSVEDGGDDEDQRFEAVVDVLAGVTRRQDEVSAAIASVLDQVRGPMGVDAVLDRMEQRERSLAARLDRIDSELRRRTEGPDASAEASPKPDPETARVLRNVAELVERQERTFGARLDRLGAEVRGIADASVPAADAGNAEKAALQAVLSRLNEQEGAIASNLEWVGSRLAEVAAHLVPDEVPAIDTVSEPARDERIDGLVEALTSLDRRQDELSEAIAAVLDHVRRPVADEGAAQRAEEGERYLDARFDRIEAELRQARDAAPDDEAGRALLAAVDSIAANTANLARVVESTAERLELRLTAVEDGLEASARAADQLIASSPSEAEIAALRLAELRAERAHVQARLQEERLLAAQAYDDDAYYDDP